LCVFVCVCVNALILLSGVMQDDRSSGVDVDAETEVHRNRRLHVFMK